MVPAEGALRPGGPRRTRAWSVAVLVLVFTLANTILFHRPLLRAALATIQDWGLEDWPLLATLLALQFTLTVAALGTASLLSARLVKPLAVLLLAGNAVALYFIDTYGIVIDRTMMGNVFNTDWQEGSALLAWRMLGYLAVFAVVPAVLLWKIPVADEGRLRRAGVLGAAVLLGVLWCWSNAASWLWIDKNASRFGALILPWSYVGNSARHFAAEADARRQFAQLPPVQVDRPGPALVVLVIGEAARPQNFSLYGYARPTNPELARRGVVVLPQVSACATYTTAAVRCILSHDLESPAEPLTTYLQRNGVRVNWRTNNSGEPRMEVASFQRAAELRPGCTGPGCDHDEVLLTGLAESLREAAVRKSLVVLHQGGSHGPQYAVRYPPAFERFSPVCRGVDLSRCDPGSLVNAYDNTIAYTDHVVARVVDTLRSMPEIPSVLLYLSDHGESLGEWGLYLHGTPYSLAPEEQKRIPFLVWMSDGFARSRGLDPKALVREPAYSQAWVFHSVMGALGLSSPAYKPALDLFRQTAPGARP